MTVGVYGSLQELPGHYGRLIEVCGQRCFLDSLTWYRMLLGTTIDDGDQVRIYGIEGEPGDDLPLGMMVARVPRCFSEWRTPRQLAGFTNFYTLRFGPVLRPSVANPGDVIHRLIEAMIAEKPAWDLISFCPILKDSPVFEPLVAALRAVGMIVEPYWHRSN